jgi:hypothetical protein
MGHFSPKEFNKDCKIISIVKSSNFFLDSCLHTHHPQSQFFLFSISVLCLMAWPKKSETQLKRKMSYRT